MEVKTESGTLVSSVAAEVAETSGEKVADRKPKTGKKYAAGGIFTGEVYKNARGVVHEDN